MAEYTALAPLFTDIANAIRSKTGETGQITANNFPDKISSIPFFSSMFSSKCKYNSDASSGDIYVTNLNTLNFTNYFVFGFVYNVVIGVALHITQKNFLFTKELDRYKIKICGNSNNKSVYLSFTTQNNEPIYAEKMLFVINDD